MTKGQINKTKYTKNEPFINNCINNDKCDITIHNNNNNIGKYSRDNNRFIIPILVFIIIIIEINVILTQN